MGSPLPDVWIHLAALAIYGPLIVLLHELGHAALARAGGYRVTDFAIGMGRPLWRVEVRGGAVIHVDRWFFAGGSCTAILVAPGGARRAWFHLGGLLVQLALALLLLPWVHVELARHALAFNALVFAHNALPWRIGAVASDGWHALDAWSGRGRGTDVLAQYRALERLACRAEQVGSPMGIAYTRVCLAWADVLAGRPRRADPLFRDDPPETALEPWVDALYHYVRAEWDRTQGRALGALRTAREAVLSVDLGGTGEAEALIALAEARALVDLDAPHQALRALSRAAGVAGPIGWQAEAIRVWATLDEPAALERAVRRLLLRADRAALDRADAAMALWVAAQALARAGRDRAADDARAGAISLAARALHDAPAELGAALARRMGPVAGEAAPEHAAAGRW